MLMMALQKPHYSQSLRVIGQSLDVLHPGGFQLTNEGDSFVVRTNPNGSTREGSLTKSIIKRLWRSSHSDERDSSLQYDLEAISRLETQQRAKRGESASMPDTQTISQVLRVVGDYLDHKQPRAFTVDWTPSSVSVSYEATNGSSDRETFSVADLYDLAVYMYVHRASRAS